MCGLSGAIGSIKPKDDQVIKDLLFLMSLRGIDSTGIGVVPKAHFPSDPIRWAKTIGGPWNLFDMKSFDKLLNSWNCVILGHNRSMTQGGVSIKNAHPFFHQGAYSPGILGMHNGTVRKDLLKDHANYGTDSEAIIAMLAEVGPEETIKKLDGAYTLIWYDKKDHTINMIRNEKRPLTFTFNKDKNVLYFGSELGLTVNGLTRNGIETGDYMTLPENILHTWKVPPEGAAFEEPVETKLEGYKYPLGVVNTNQYITPGQIRSHFTGSGGRSVTANPTSSTATSATTTQKKSTGPRTFNMGLVGDGSYKGMISYGVVNGNRIYRDPLANMWITAMWDKSAKDFVNYYGKQAPKALPFTKLDINANHSFKHHGKKKNKVIYYIGFENRYLTEEDFNYNMSFGCSACGRQPEWGNSVTWLNKDHDFLCEYCSLDAPLVNTWKKAS
jgi:predicted glutamine amidotransferase